MIPARAAAAQAVAAVLEGQSLDRAVTGARKRVNHRDAALVQELAYGTIRHWFRLRPLLALRLRKPLKPRDRALEALLVGALYELICMRTPGHAAVQETVGAVNALDRKWARGLVNAILRGALREPNGLEPPAASIAEQYGWPDWLADRIAEDWPNDWPAIAATGLERAPMTLRVNTTRGSREDYAKRLQDQEIAFRASRHAPAGIELVDPVPVDQLPGFHDGDLSVQDAAAQLAAPLLAPIDGMRVLDACAAPGGKTGHLAELGQPADLVAVERDAARTERIRENLTRLGAQAQVHTGDAAQPDSWWDGKPFDRILLDVPCSGTGVIRRHPDIRLLRRPTDTAALAATQDQLLDAVWPLLAPGGMLLYTTCSILQEENAERIRAFRARHQNARAVELNVHWGRQSGDGRQILPGEDGMDGFFYALLVRE